MKKILIICKICVVLSTVLVLVTSHPHTYRQQPEYYRHFPEFYRDQWRSQLEPPQFYKSTVHEDLWPGRRYSSPVNYIPYNSGFRSNNYDLQHNSFAPRAIIDNDHSFESVNPHKVKKVSVPLTGGAHQIIHLPETGDPKDMKVVRVSLNDDSTYDFSDIPDSVKEILARALSGIRSNPKRVHSDNKSSKDHFLRKPNRKPKPKKIPPSKVLPQLVNDVPTKQHHKNEKAFSKKPAIYPGHIEPKTTRKATKNDVKTTATAVSLSKTKVNTPPTSEKLNPIERKIASVYPNSGHDDCNSFPVIPFPEGKSTSATVIKPSPAYDDRATPTHDNNPTLAHGDKPTYEDIPSPAHEYKPAPAYGDKLSPHIIRQLPVLIKRGGHQIIHLPATGDPIDTEIVHVSPNQENTYVKSDIPESVEDILAKALAKTRSNSKDTHKDNQLFKEVSISGDSDNKPKPINETLSLSKVTTINQHHTNEKISPKEPAIFPVYKETNTIVTVINDDDETTETDVSSSSQDSSDSTEEEQDSNNVSKPTAAVKPTQAFIEREQAPVYPDPDRDYSHFPPVIPVSAVKIPDVKSTPVFNDKPTPDSVLKPISGSVNHGPTDDDCNSLAVTPKASCNKPTPAHDNKPTPHIIRPLSVHLIRGDYQIDLPATGDPKDTKVVHVNPNQENTYVKSDIPEPVEDFLAKALAETISNSKDAHKDNQASKDVSISGDSDNKLNPNNETPSLSKVPTKSVSDTTIHQQHLNEKVSLKEPAIFPDYKEANTIVTVINNDDETTETDVSSSSEDSSDATEEEQDSTNVSKSTDDYDFPPEIPVPVAKIPTPVVKSTPVFVDKSTPDPVVEPTLAPINHELTDNDSDSLAFTPRASDVKPSPVQGVQSTSVHGDKPSPTHGTGDPKDAKIPNYENTYVRNAIPDSVVEGPKDTGLSKVPTKPVNDAQTNHHHTNEKLSPKEPAISPVYKEVNTIVTVISESAKATETDVSSNEQDDSDATEEEHDIDSDEIPTPVVKNTQVLFDKATPEPVDKSTPASVNHDPTDDNCESPEFTPRASSVKPTPVNGDQPTPVHDVKPTPTYGDKPTPAHGDKPIPAHDNKPTPVYNDQPKSNNVKPAPKKDVTEESDILTKLLISNHDVKKLIQGMKDSVNDTNHVPSAKPKHEKDDTESKQVGDKEAEDIANKIKPDENVSKTEEVSFEIAKQEKFDTITEHIEIKTAAKHEETDTENTDSTSNAVLDKDQYETDDLLAEKVVTPEDFEVIVITREDIANIAKNEPENQNNEDTVDIDKNEPIDPITFVVSLIRNAIKGSDYVKEMLDSPNVQKFVKEFF